MKLLQYIILFNIGLLCFSPQVFADATSPPLPPKYDQRVKNYINDTAIRNSYKKTIEYFSEIANQRNIKTQLLLGFIYFYGVGVDKNYTKAKEYFSEAANQGSVDAQLFFGFIYLHGIGVNKDYEMSALFLLMPSIKKA